MTEVAAARASRRLATLCPERPFALFAACGPWRKQSPVRAGAGAYPRRSSLRADSPAMLGLAARRQTHSVRFALCVRTTATSSMTKRAGTRAAASPALLGASHARQRLPARAFAEAAVVRRHATGPAARQAVPARGDFGGGEQRSGGLGARSALRQLTRRRCPNAESEANGVSLAARARSEQRSGVGPQGRPPRHEPLAGTACRAARTPPLRERAERTSATCRLRTSLAGP